MMNTGLGHVVGCFALDGPNVVDAGVVAILRKLLQLCPLEEFAHREKAVDIVAVLGQVHERFHEHIARADRVAEDANCDSLTSIFESWKKLRGFVDDTHPYSIGDLKNVARVLKEKCDEDIAGHLSKHEAAIRGFILKPYNPMQSGSEPLKDIVGGMVGGIWSTPLNDNDSFKKVCKQVTKTLMTIPTVPFAAAVTKLDQLVTKAHACVRLMTYSLGG